MRDRGKFNSSSDFLSSEESVAAARDADEGASRTEHGMKLRMRGGGRLLSSSRFRLVAVIRRWDREVIDRFVIHRELEAFGNEIFWKGLVSRVHDIGSLRMKQRVSVTPVYWLL